MKNKTTFIEEYIVELKSLDEETFSFVDAKLKCPHCTKKVIPFNFEDNEDRKCYRFLKKLLFLVEKR